MSGVVVMADVLPANYGTPEWIEWRAPLVELARKRLPDGSEAEQVQWADDFLRREADRGDLRALGFCGDCGGSIKLCQVGRCVYGEPCGHYRAQGDLPRMQRFLDRSLATITPERRAALLALIHREAGR